MIPVVVRRAQQEAQRHRDWLEGAQRAPRTSAAEQVAQQHQVAREQYRRAVEVGASCFVPALSIKTAF